MLGLCYEMIIHIPYRQPKYYQIMHKPRPTDTQFQIFMNNVTNAINFNSESILDLNFLEAFTLQGCYAAQIGSWQPTINIYALAEA